MNLFFHPSTCQMLGGPSSAPGGEKDTWPSCFFGRKFNFEQLLIEAFFDIIGTFGSVQR